MEYLLQTQAGNFCGLWWVKLGCMNRIVNTGEGLFRTGSHSCTYSNQAGIWTDLLFVFVLSRRKYYIFDYIEFELIRIQLHVALERNESFLRDCAKRSKVWLFYLNAFQPKFDLLLKIVSDIHGAVVFPSSSLACGAINQSAKLPSILPPGVGDRVWNGPPYGASQTRPGLKDLEGKVFLYIHGAILCYVRISR